MQVKTVFVLAVVH